MSSKCYQSVTWGGDSFVKSVTKVFLKWHSLSDSLDEKVTKLALPLTKKHNLVA